jgi:hypothetical protein
MNFSPALHQTGIISQQISAVTLELAPRSYTQIYREVIIAQRLLWRSCHVYPLPSRKLPIALSDFAVLAIFRILKYSLTSITCHSGQQLHASCYLRIVETIYFHTVSFFLNSAARSWGRGPSLQSCSSAAWVVYRARVPGNPTHNNSHTPANGNDPSSI